MPRVLLVDTGFSAVPIYNFISRAGYEVYVCGANPKDFLAKSSKNYIPIDYADLDQMRALIRKLGVDYLVPGCNDLSYQVCAAINIDGKFPGLDSIETSNIIHHKNKFKVLAAHIGLPVPSVVSVEQVGLDEIWPLIVKPVDSYSGRGMTIIQKTEYDQLENAIEYAKKFSRSQNFIIEEFVTGQLYSHSAFLFSQKIIADFIVEEHGVVNPFVVDTSRVIDNFSIEMLQNIRNSILLLANELKLVDGLIHTQFMVKDSHYWIIEITRRCPGDLYSRLIQASTGFSYAQTYAMPFLNQKFYEAIYHPHPSFIMRHTISQSFDTTFSWLQFRDILKIEQFVPLCMTGDHVKKSPFGRIGLLFAKSDSKYEFDQLFNKTINRNLYFIN